MKCQRARILSAPPAYRTLVGKELWVEATTPHYEDKVYSMTSQTYVVCPRECRTPYAMAGGFAFGVEAHRIEWLARGPEDFCELAEFIPWEQWLVENGLTMSFA